MSENGHNFFGSNAAIGGFLGAAIGDGNLIGGNRNALTPDQFQAGLNNVQNQNNANAIQGHLNGIQNQICESTSDITAAVTGSGASVKDAVTNASALNQLALCQLGHKIEHGISTVNQNILLQAAASRELALQQALNQSRDHATELRIELTEHKNQAGHNATQVQIQTLVGALGK